MRFPIRPARLVPLALVCSLVLTGSLAGQSLDEVTARLRAGEYDEAIQALRTLARGSGADLAAQKAYARALSEIGEYDRALEVVSGQGDAAVSVELENTRGEILFALGRLPEAEAAFRRAVDGATDGLTAQKNLGVLLWDRGERAEALSIFDSFIDVYNGASGGLTSEELVAIGTGVRYLGVTDPDLFQDALMAFDEAAAADPDAFTPHLLVGELFLEKYKASDARESFGLVLERNPRHPRALLGQARVLDFEGVGGAVETVQAALEVNPRYPDAWAFLAGLYLKTWEHQEAREAAEQALEVNPGHLRALSILAASFLLAGEDQEYGEVRERLQALNPTYPDLFTVAAEQAAAQHQYALAVGLASQAVALDSTSWWAYGVLGTNQMRTQEMEEARRNLERAFAGDPYNPWYKNTLDLLDTFVHYQRVQTEHFEIFIHEREVDLLGPYAAKVAEEAYEGLRGRYAAEPPTPIRLEIYPSHSDFSVRTLGLTGLGALGVSFGSTLVMDSPSARRPGEFNWASTLWHEVAHAFHLAMTRHKVPRWFTEGLAVHEQRTARPEWGHKPGPGWLQAYEAGRLFPVSRLNEGFVRPRFPEQVVFSYLQASLVLELIEDRHGLSALLEMMEGYRAGKTDEEIFPEVLDQSLEEFDETFDAYVQDQWGPRIQAVVLDEEAQGDGTVFHGPGQNLDALRQMVRENPGSFPFRLALGKALFDQERFDEAESELREALRLFPEYGGPDSPYLYLAHIHRMNGELERAAGALRQLGGLNESLFSVHAEEAELRLELGQVDEATRALEKVVEIAPFDLAPHGTLAGLYRDVGEAEGAVLERRALLALDPTDRVEAHYQLALALSDAGELSEARSQVLKALELAPTYDPALELLLSLRERIR